MTLSGSMAFRVKPFRQISERLNMNYIQVVRQDNEIIYSVPRTAFLKKKLSENAKNVTTLPSAPNKTHALKASRTME